jgi:5-methylcytosine-specific restriction endonuclease McrA
VRIRQVRPEFWTDERLASLPDAVRLFYIGLWGVADDVGWMRWEPMRIGALLYPYRSPKRRDRDIAAWSVLLVDMDRLVIHECGCAHIPTLSKHQVIGGRKSEGEYRRHIDRHPNEQRRESIRQRVLERDRFSCRYCGSQPEPDRLVAEHIINGGPTTMENLVTACRGCNTRKGKRSVEEAGMTLLPEPVQIVPDVLSVSSNGTVGDVTGGAGGWDAKIIEMQRRGTA